MNIARDTSIWDQTGCLSPKCVYMEGSANDALHFARTLVEALDRTADTLPETTPTLAELSKKNSALIMAEITGSTVIRASKNHDCVLVHPYVMDPILLPRTLNIFPVTAIAESAMHLAPYGLALASKNPLTDMQKKAFSAAGFNHFPPLGQMQNPPLTWFHDNVGTIRPYFVET